MAYLYGEDEEIESLYGRPPVPPTTSPDPQSSVREELRATIAQGPPVAPKPKWWQRLAAGAAAFGPGYVNAGGRVHIPQENINATTEAIMAPGYRQKMGEFQARKQGLQEVAGMEQQDEQNAMRRRESEARIASEKAQEEAARARAAAAGKTTPKVAPPSIEEKESQTRAARTKTADELGLTDRDRKVYIATGQVPQPRAEAAPRETPEQATKRRTDEATAQGLKGRDRTEFILTGRLPKPPKATGASQPKAASPASYRAVESNKQRSLAAVEAKFRSGDLLPEELEAEKQRIQNAYEAEIEALGGSAQHMEYGTSPRPTGAPPTAPAPAVAGGGVTKLKDPKTGQVRRFSGLSPQDLADAQAQGFVLVK
jgi:hypothetical protein